jgi:hypothetical protein
VQENFSSSNEKNLNLFVQIFLTKVKGRRYVVKRNKKNFEQKKV